MNMPEVDPEVTENAVSVYGQSDAYEDFPVLKAFQQYIDTEQAKARKRLLLLCAFFGILMFVVISVFVLLLVNVSSRNQALNDRLVEFAMNERNQRGSSQVVVQPAQDNMAILSLTTKLEEMQKKLAESQANAEKLAAEVAESTRKAELEAKKPKAPTPEALEIQRLKALLASEREKQAVEREKQRQAELEEYRRKQYPELYGLSKDEDKKPKKGAVTKEREIDDADNDDLLKEVDKILDDGEAVRYFDDDEEDEIPTRKKASAKRTKSSPPPSPKEYSIPVDIRGSSSRWNVPNE